MLFNGKQNNMGDPQWLIPLRWRSFYLKMDP
jgi:hypothetical protein